jgi:hypothetical protein
MKGDAENLITEAMKLLDEPSDSGRAESRPIEHKEDPKMETPDQPMEETRGKEAMVTPEKIDFPIEKAEVDQPKRKKEPERNFWFKLAEQSF